MAIAASKNWHSDSNGNCSSTAAGGPGRKLEGSPIVSPGSAPSGRLGGRPAEPKFLGGRLPRAVPWSVALLRFGGLEASGVKSIACLPLSWSEAALLPRKNSFSCPGRRLLASCRTIVVKTTTTVARRSSTTNSRLASRRQVAATQRNSSHRLQNRRPTGHRKAVPNSSKQLAVSQPRVQGGLLPQARQGRANCLVRVQKAVAYPQATPQRLDLVRQGGATRDAEVWKDTIDSSKQGLGQGRLLGFSLHSSHFANLLAQSKNKVLDFLELVELPQRRARALTRVSNGTWLKREVLAWPWDDRAHGPGRKR